MRDSPTKPQNSKRRAVFLDRDGTISEEMGYVNHLTRFVMFPYAPAAIRRLNQAGLPVIVVTNQSGVARNFFPESLIPEVHDKMKAELAAAGARVDAIYYCPHIRDDNCKCRKPLPGMLEQAAREHVLDLADSVLVSDRYDDISMGQSVGCHSILVLSGYGRGEYEYHRDAWPRQPDHVVEDLTAAVDLILGGKP
ncbi:MAG TPA: HAD family hydrolase [Candidatus Acidoferrales bacterium]|nr:HAD family hydrolase [Candidatus Acidoferrales bacterium]